MAACNLEDFKWTHVFVLAALLMLQDYVVDLLPQSECGNVSQCKEYMHSAIRHNSLQSATSLSKGTVYVPLANQPP